jgi:putative sigma-54 modulation protein
MIKFRVHKSNEKLAEEDLSLINKAFVSALDRFKHVLREVQVSFIDVNGPRGGLDKKCSVQMKLSPSGVVVAHSTRSSFVEAANDACDKIRQLVSRRSDKLRSRIHTKQKRFNLATVLDLG